MRRLVDPVIRLGLDYRRRWQRWRVNRRLPLTGHAEGLPTPGVDDIDDAELERLNALLPWHCYTLDAHGRRFGAAAFAGKRTEPQNPVDRRVALLDQRLPLAERRVLEVGCFEGIHTLALLAAAREVVAIDARIDNVVKTIVRCALFGHHATVRCVDVEAGPLPEALAVDVVWHVGVLYHLADPVRHLRDLGRIAGEALLLDTHVCPAERATAEYRSGADTFAYERHREFGRRDPFSGVADHAKWLSLETLRAVLTDAGFDRIEVIEERDERNGPRVLLLAARTGGS